MADSKDAREFTSGLARDLDTLSESMDGMMYKFGQWGRANNKWWTIFARFTSGTFLWRAQARIRAMSNVFELFTDAQEGAMKNNLKSLDSYMILNKGLDKTILQQQALGDILTDLNNAADEGSRLDVLEDYMDIFPELIAFANQGKTAMEAFAEVQEIVDYKQDQFDKKIAINQKGLMGYYKDIGQAQLSKLKDFGQKALGLQDKDEHGNQRSGWQKAGGFLSSPVKGLHKLQLQVLKGFKGFMGGFAKVIQFALAGFKTAMIYGAVIIIGLLFFVTFIKKFGPRFATLLGEFVGFFKIAWSGLMLILGGVWDVLAGIWTGDLGRVLEGVFTKILPGLFNLALGVFLSAIGLLISVIGAIWMAAIDTLVHIVKRIPIIGGLFSEGGVTPGGPVIVGEKGPELVNLPAGSRVHSNADSKKMIGGNTIHIHINGRVGASDAEIRDIANKVAREINLRMNRTATNVIGG